MAFQEWNARENRVEKVEDAGKWLSSHIEYSQWSESTTSSALWLEGKPGSGKSTLAKRIVSKLEDRENEPRSDIPSNPSMGEQGWTFNNPGDKSTIIARFYYSFRGGHTETSHELMFRSIVYQIWKNNSRLHKLIDALYRQSRKVRTHIRYAHAREEIDSPWGYEDLKWILSSLHKIDFPLNIVIVVDGMDESDNDRRADVLQFLLGLAAQNSNCIVKVLIASRPESDINSRLGKACSGHIILQKENRQDIELVVERWIERMISERNCKRDTFQSIKDYIITESLGVFLWVTLVLRDVEQCVVRGGYSKADLDERVRGLPKELGGENSFYKQMILSLVANCQEDKKQEERGRRIFQWVTFAKQPLLVEELQDVLATPHQSQKVELSGYDLKKHKPLELDHGILSVCGGLVEVSYSLNSIITNLYFICAKTVSRFLQIRDVPNSRRVVQLIHQTAREFLLHGNQLAKPYHVDQIQGDTEIAITCCRFICIVFTTAVLQTEADSDFLLAEKVAEQLSNQAMFMYALTNIGKHQSHLDANGGNDQVCLELEDFVTELSKRRNSYAFLLLWQWIETLINWPKELVVDANETAAEGCINAVLSHWPSDDDEHRLAHIMSALRTDLLHIQAASGHLSLERRVALEIGADVNAKNHHGLTPLLLAAANGHTDSAFVLFQYNADSSVMNHDRQTPFSVAAAKGYEDLVQLLFDHGADINTKDKYSQTPLSRAAAAGHEKTVRLLLKFGVDIEIKDHQGQTPLSLAATEGHEKIVHLLLHYGADSNTEDKCGQTPLSRAIANGHEMVVTMLGR